MNIVYLWLCITPHGQRDAKREPAKPRGLLFFVPDRVKASGFTAKEGIHHRGPPTASAVVVTARLSGRLTSQTVLPSHRRASAATLSPPRAPHRAARTSIVEH